MLTAVEYLGGVGIGATSPRLFRASDGHIYVVKLQNNRLGPKVLANELLAALFGRQLQLCFPDSGVIMVNQALIQNNKQLRRLRVVSGLHFASRYLSDAKYVDRHSLAKAVNKKQMAGVMLFDHLFHNNDRTYNRRNLLIKLENGYYRLYAIDHSHLFGRSRWTIELLNQRSGSIRLNKRRAFGWLLKYYLAQEDFSVYIDRIKCMGDEEMWQMVCCIPYEWLPEYDERNALLDYLKKRRDMIDEIARPLLTSIADIHRAAKVDQ